MLHTKTDVFVTVLQNLLQCAKDETLEEDARSGRNDSGKVEKEERNRGEEKKEKRHKHAYSLCCFSSLERVKPPIRGRDWREAADEHEIG